MAGDQRLRQRQHVLRLVPEETDRLDVVADRLLAERCHGMRILGCGEQAASRLVDARIGRLGGQDDGDEKRERVAVFELGFGLRTLDLEAPEDLGNLFRSVGDLDATLGRAARGCPRGPFRRSLGASWLDPGGRLVDLFNHHRPIASLADG